MTFLRFRLEYFDDRVGRIATLGLNAEFMLKKFCLCSLLVFLEGILKELESSKTGIRSGQSCLRHRGGDDLGQGIAITCGYQRRQTGALCGGS